MCYFCGQINLTMTQSLSLRELVEQMPTITLKEMKSIRLMKRTDTKFVTHMNKLLELLAMAQGHYFVQKVRGEMLSPYATTYFDSRDRFMFRIHQCGSRPRMKVRVRSYTNDGETFLEIKRKDNRNKTHKVRMQVPSLEDVLNDGVGEDFLQLNTGKTFADLQPTVANRFRRITLVNFEKTERLTIDFDIRFRDLQTGAETSFDDAVVIELKRDGRAASPILPLLRKLRIHPGGFSKYCVGTVMTGSGLRVNRYKKNLQRIHKRIQQGQ